MRAVLRQSSCIFAFAALIVFVSECQTRSSAVVAIASGPVLSLYDATGAEVQRIDLKKPVAGFDFTADRTKVVIVSRDTEHGGALIEIDLKTGSRTKLTGRHFASEHLSKGETEVYDSPSFSPDGHKLAFAVHGNLPGDGNDAWENSGPLAILDLDSNRLSVLKATENIYGNGPCSESAPQWSPDGQWILFNCEDGAFLTDPQGGSLRDLKLSTENASSNAVGWVGKNCVLYLFTPETEGKFDFEHETLRLLNLRDFRTSDGGSLFRGFGGSSRGLVQASSDAVIRIIPPKIIVQTKNKMWELDMGEKPREPQSVSARLLADWAPSSIPPQCR